MVSRLSIAGFDATRLALILSLAARVAYAQAPSEFTSLQYFQKTISRDELIGVMRGFCFSLNVRCQYCHAGKDGPNLKYMNFPSDEKETKRTARASIRWVDAMNKP